MSRHDANVGCSAGNCCGVSDAVCVTIVLAALTV